MVQRCISVSLQPSSLVMASSHAKDVNFSFKWVSNIDTRYKSVKAKFSCFKAVWSLALFLKGPHPCILPPWYFVGSLEAVSPSGRNENAALAKSTS